MLHFAHTIALISLFGLVSLAVPATETGPASANGSQRSSADVREMACGRFRVTAFADYKERKFGVLLREYERDATIDHPKLLRSFVFPETQAEFDFRVAAETVYCELKDNYLVIYGRGYDEAGEVIYRIRVHTSSWTYEFSRVLMNEISQRSQGTAMSGSTRSF